MIESKKRATESEEEGRAEEGKKIIRIHLSNYNRAFTSEHTNDFDGSGIFVFRSELISVK